MTANLATCAHPEVSIMNLSGDGTLSWCSACGALRRSQWLSPRGNKCVRSGHTDADQICAITARVFDLSVTELMSPPRPERIAWPRQIAMYLVRTLLEWPLQDVGNYFSKDHGTVLHACRLVSGRLTIYPEIAANVAFIIEAFKSCKNAATKIALRSTEGEIADTQPRALEVAR